ncbi:hypothetical protein [Actinomadura rupiterrae]|uniref:hypothetical protein n=1 Tax=Actinomadura rupiterrae TaxID=559627 RepID=UPI0020A5FFA1|nr:hypothetical protein [Actinomadura rupiterrae]MCP2339862.1 hypothetical protein [Actinomadura rupiterrae]
MMRRPPKRWPVILFRVAAVLQALLVLLQAVLAGRFLSGGYGALSMHSANAMFTATVGLLTIAAAVLVWRPGGGPAKLIGPSVAMVVLETVQITLGFGRVLALHVPLGTALLVGAATLVRLGMGLPTSAEDEAPVAGERVEESV